MRIAVLVKVVPDTSGERALDPETGLLLRADDGGIDEICERAIEAAVTFAESGSESDGDHEVVLVAVGPDAISGAVRRGLAMGAHRALHVVDDALVGADLLLTADTLAAAVRTLDADLVLTGNISTDGASGVLPVMVAELLALPFTSALTEIEIHDDGIVGARTRDGRSERISVALPVVAAVSDAFPEPRFPNFKGIVAAKKKPYTTVSLAELGVTADPGAPSSILIEVAPAPPRAAGTIITDTGDAAARLARFLLDRDLV